MSEPQVPVETPGERSWKQALRQPKVWIPVVAGVALVGIVGTAAAVAAGGEDPTAPSASPSASTSPAVTASPSLTQSASPSPSASPSASATPSPSPSETASAYVPSFPLPGQDTSTLVATFGSDDGGFWDPQFTRDGAYVAVAYGGMDPSRVYVGRTDGSQLKRLDNVDDAYDATIAWSPDGQRLAFVAKTPDGPTLATVARDGSGRKLLAPLPTSPQDPDRWVQAALNWSSNGKSIAISLSLGSTEPGEMTTMIVDAATGKSVTIEGASSATYSPTESLLAYVRADAGKKCSLVLRDALGTTKVLRTMNECLAVQTNRGIHWAPNGSRLVYGEYRGIDQIPAWHSIAKDGSGDVKLTGALWNSAVAWSADSAHVAIGDEESGLGLTIYDPVAGSGKKLTELYDYPSGLAWVGSNELVYTGDGLVNVVRVDDGAWVQAGTYSESGTKYAVTPDGTRGVYVRSNIFDTRKATVELITR